jgi:hypothetical protein
VGIGKHKSSKMAHFVFKCNKEDYLSLQKQNNAGGADSTCRALQGDAMVKTLEQYGLISYRAGQKPRSSIKCDCPDTQGGREGSTHSSAATFPGALSCR